MPTRGFQEKQMLERVCYKETSTNSRNIYVLIDVERCNKYYKMSIKVKDLQTKQTSINPMRVKFEKSSASNCKMGMKIGEFQNHITLSSL